MCENDIGIKPFCDSCTYYYGYYGESDFVNMLKINKMFSWVTGAQFKIYSSSHRIPIEIFFSKNSWILF